MDDVIERDECGPQAHVPSVLEAQRYPDSAAAWAVQVTPGSATASVLAVLQPARLSQAGRVDVLVALDRLAAWVHAEQVRILAAMAGDLNGGLAPVATARQGVKIEMDTCMVPTRQGGHAPRYHGLRPQIQVSVALSTLLGLDEQPGELDGHGPIPADVARRLAADPSGTWRRLVTDELGRLVDYGRRTYQPPADLARFVIARDRTCRAPGCNRPAVKCDVHHVVWWSRGGETNADNLVCCCERDHYAIHDGGWTAKLLDDGTTEWVSPGGRVHRVPPVTYPVDHTAKIKIDTPLEPEERDAANGRS